MEGAPAFYAAQRFARRIEAARKALRLYRADFELSTTLLRNTWEGLRSALRGAGEAGLLLEPCSTVVLADGVSLEKRATNRSFAPNAC